MVACFSYHDQGDKSLTKIQSATLKYISWGKKGNSQVIKITIVNTKMAVYGWSCGGQNT